MKLARILLASAAVLSAAACSSDRITAPARPAAPPSSIHASITPSDSTSGSSNETGTPLQVCVSSTTTVNGISTTITTCDNGQLGSGQ